MKKKSFVLIIALLFITLAPFVQGQTTKEVVTVLNSETIANSGTKTVYVNDLLGNDYEMNSDSVSFRLVATGEIDLDALIITKGTTQSSVFYALATPDTTILTINNAASATTAVLVSAATASTNSLEGIDAIKVHLIAASSGNDATDPNAITIEAIKHYPFQIKRVK